MDDPGCLLLPGRRRLEQVFETRPFLLERTPTKLPLPGSRTLPDLFICKLETISQPQGVAEGTKEILNAESTEAGAQREGTSIRGCAYKSVGRYVAANELRCLQLLSLFS